VEDLLDASRLSRGLAELHEVPLEVGQALAESVEQVRHLVQERRHALTVQLSEDALFVSGDHRRLVQVFTNLLVNAAKYTPPGGTLHVHLLAEADDVLVCVRDNGIGMSPELLRRAFMLFAQGEPSPHKPHGGLGIGLALVKSLVELHHGTVHASSAGEGLGTEMVVRLPRLAPPAAGPGTSPPG
jgi:signal transduction histidine kinase